MQEEIWKDVVGYEGLYKVSNLGRVKKIKNKLMILKPHKTEKGYLRVSLFNNSKKKCLKIHRLVAQAFIPNPINLPEINHKDENKENNYVENLEWCTHKYNCNYGTGYIRCTDIHKKTIHQYDLQGNFIKEWCGIGVASRAFGAKNSGSISACLRKIRPTAFGFKWKYADK